MPGTSRHDADRSCVAKSRLTNGRSPFVLPVDGRSALARRYRDVLNAYVADLGGDDRITEAERTLCRRAASLVVMAEVAEAELARDGKTDTEEYVRIVNALGRVLGRIGIERRPRDITPDPLEYARQKAEESTTEETAR